MTLTNAIKKLTKEGYSVEHVSGERNRLFRSNLGTRVLEFYAGEAETDHIHCIGVRPLNDQSDPLTDYCAFNFYQNLTQALRLS
jgi:hypothetical protein